MAHVYQCNGCSESIDFDRAKSQNSEWTEVRMDHVSHTSVVGHGGPLIFHLCPKCIKKFHDSTLAQG